MRLGASSIAALCVTTALAIWSGSQGVARAATGELGEVFREGNALYNQGSYEEAARQFERISKHGVENSAVHFNLGNCYFKLGRLAESLVQYEKAARLDPGDADTRDNLSLVRARLGEKPPPAPPWALRQLSRLAHLVPLGTMLWIALGAYLGLNALVGAAIVRGRRGSSKSTVRLVLVVVLAAVLAWSAGASAAGVYRREVVKEAIVLEADTPVVSAPAEGSAVLFTLPLGHTVRLRSAAGGWLHVSLESGWHGWVPADKLGKI